MCGLICANYGKRVNTMLRESKSAYHAECYQQHHKVAFPVLQPQDLDDALVDEGELDNQEEEIRFKQARDGDHLLTPFQCNMCHFYNIHKRDPIRGNTGDKLLALAESNS